MTWELVDRGGRTLMRAMGARPGQLGRLYACTAVGRGTLPPIVLLHGVGASGVSWALVMRRLLEHAGRIVVPDLPGHGLSPAREPATLQGVLDGLDEALAALATETPEPLLLIGHSLGALMAIRFALRHPDRVRGLVLLTPAGATTAEGALDKVTACLDVRTNAAASALFDQLLARPVWYARLAGPYLHETYARPSVRAIVASVCVADMLTTADLRALRPPTLLLWGSQDRLLPASDLAHFRASLPPHAEIVEVATFGHGAPLERPAEVVEHVLRFAKGHA